MRFFFCTVNMSWQTFFIILIILKIDNCLRIRPVMIDVPRKLEAGSDDFTYLTKLEERCKRLTDRESEYLGSFYNRNLKCFQIYPYLNTNRISITSSCTSLDTIMENPAHWKGICMWESTTSDDIISIKDIVDGLKTAKWNYDAFQTPVLVSTLCNMKAADPSDPKFIKAIKLIIDRKSQLQSHRNQKYSTVIRYKNTKALLDVVKNGFIPAAYFGTHKIGDALDSANIIAFDELCRQLAFYNSGDRAHFDVIILIYSLLTYYETSSDVFRSSYAKGVLEPTNMKLVQAALQIIFQSQAEDGTWRKGEPIFTESSSNKNRDIGNSYVFFFEFIGGLLGPLGENEPMLLAPFLPQLERCLTWAESNILQEMLPEVCDPTTFRCYGKMVKGWRSNHLGSGSGGAACWCTAQVFFSLTRFRKLLRTLITNSILEEFGGRRASGGAAAAGDRDREWVALMDADLDIAGVKSSLKTEIGKRLLNPLSFRERTVKTSLLPPASDPTPTGASMKPSYSAILFGPPGTAKTTICTSIASALGWNFLTIDTADFLADGLQNAASRMTYIFDRLRALERTIILFDEVEEFCLDRENPSLSMESRMLTTAMLTQLNDLRRQQASAFIVATNRLRSFDAAVTRPGRFDMLLFVGTPNLLARLDRISSKLQSTRLSAKDREDTLTFCKGSMEARWEVMRFLTFAESEGFADTVVDLASRGALNDETLETRLQSILKTATIQGGVKEDYIASESLSRV